MYTFSLLNFRFRFFSPRRRINVNLVRSRQELFNEYLLAKIGVDTAENEPLEVWGKIFNIIHWCPYSSGRLSFRIFVILSLSPRVSPSVPYASSFLKSKAEYAAGRTLQRWSTVRREMCVSLRARLEKRIWGGVPAARFVNGLTQHAAGTGFVSARGADKPPTSTRRY